MKEVRWTETAIKTLRETSDFILELWNSDVNDEFIAQIDHRISQLQNNPELAPAFENTEIRGLIIHRTVSLFYVNTPQIIGYHSSKITRNLPLPSRILKSED